MTHLFKGQPTIKPANNNNIIDNVTAENANATLDAAIAAKDVELDIAVPKQYSYWEGKMLDLQQGLMDDDRAIYLADLTIDICQRFEWVCFNKSSILCIKEVATAYHEEVKEYKKDPADNTPPDAPALAILCGVYCIDKEYFFMGPEKNWNPYKDFGGLEGSKATCLLSKAAESIFANDFYLQDKNVCTLVEMGHSDNGHKLNGIFVDSPDNHNLLKIHHVLFEVNVTPLHQSHLLTIAALYKLDEYEKIVTEEKLVANRANNLFITNEKSLEGWLVRRQQAKRAIKSMLTKYKVVALSAFEMMGAKIRSTKYNAALKGTNAQFHFMMAHWKIGKGDDRQLLADTCCGSDKH
ncbi:hypothetical protein PHLCEN_2v1223 [Hermanssonia centrifuga]|uniref:Uncharacterized protein n=1 Tax=Hermanssonia centrifuga TaxID=98765 RepID=A0A2R6S3T9_9APHY|nr:hypothetical protein PHLCEN_2v1223 [Hermanssonia centrifuga]